MCTPVMFFAVDRALNSYFMIMIIKTALTHKHANIIRIVNS